MSQNPYSSSAALLSDPRITNEVLGAALREAVSHNSDEYHEIVIRASIIAAEKEVK